MVITTKIFVYKTDYSAVLYRTTEYFYEFAMTYGIKEVLQDKADEKKAQRTAPVQTKHKQQDMEL